MIRRGGPMWPPPLPGAGARPSKKRLALLGPTIHFAATPRPRPTARFPAATQGRPYRGIPSIQHKPDKHHRKSIRLRGYDYAQPGAYFITICTYYRERLFGDVIDEEMRLNPAGEMVQRRWIESLNKFPLLALD